MKKNTVNNLYIKFWRNNIFLNLTKANGHLIFKCSGGYIKSEQQGNLIWDLAYLIKYMCVKVNFKGDFNINLILEGAVNSARIESLYNLLLKWGFIVNFVKVVDKIPHNGCRLKKKTSKLRKRSYLR